MAKPKQEEYEIEQEPAQQIVEHFKQPISQTELATKLSYYHELCTELAALEASKDVLRKELLEAGRGMESVTAGGYAAFFKKVAGRVSCDWKQAYKDAVGEMPEADVRKYITKSEESVRMEVKKLG